MVNFNFLISAALLASLVCATSPFLNERRSNITFPQYYLATHVVNGGPSKYDGLYIQAYHTGAGLNDVVLGTGPPENSYATIGYLNGTQQLFNMDSAFPFSLVLGGDENYAGWELATINAGLGNPSFQFAFNGSGLISTSQEWGGWLACDWWHDAVQLFWIYSYYSYYTIPSSCAIVQLVQEPIFQPAKYR
ncbi:MAG: hypothetical protein M1827_003557 [Pycnora praestabilis]|nr:MAG: hypothetical protein M1827_003557 [Pycnora praestabilis]